MCFFAINTSLNLCWTYFIGHVDHSARVMRVIKWHRSFEVTPGADGSKGDFIDDEWETHATVLDKILAWEKRLYDEVKVNVTFSLNFIKLIKHI